MTTLTRETVFKLKLSQTESKAEAVSRIARSMIEQEAALRQVKTARLREARLAKEAAEHEIAAGVPKPVRRSAKR